MTYASGVTVSYVYDELDRVKKICYAYSGGNPTAAYEYTYDANGYLHKFTDRVSGQVTVYKYTQSGRLREYYVNDLDPSKKSQTGVYNEYDAEGRISSRFIARDCLVSGEIDEVWWESGYRYNDDGTLAGFTTSFDEARYDGHYTYDDLGRLTGDSVGLRTTLISSAPAGTVSSSYTYSSNGASTSLRISGVSTSYTYGTTVSDTENRSYTYNSAGYITHIYKDGVLQYSYAYDDLGQLTRENNLPANRTYLYSYDKDGNMLSKTECSYTTSGTPSIIGVTSFTYGNGRSDVLKKITLPDGQTFTPTHDIVGNPSSVMIENGNTMAAMWSYGRRLTGLSSGSEAFSYSYNADGIRTAKTVNGVKHTYALSGTTILNEEWTENGVQHLLMYVYDANGSPVGMVYRNSTMAADATEEYLFVKNIQGDILHVYNSTGNKLVSYVYDAWGNIISTTYSNGGSTSAARFNPFTYRGYYRDSETGMYYLNSRYYNPRMGRFISADDINNLGAEGDVLSHNLYIYCLNNPVNRTDAQGEWSIPNWAKIAIGAVATVAAVAVTVATGGAAAPVLLSVAASTVGGAATAAIKHRVNTGSWDGAGEKAIEGAVNGFMVGGLCALGGSVAGGAVRTIKNARSGITIGKVGEFEKVAEIANTRHYSGLKEFGLIQKTLGTKAAETIGWWQNKCVVKGVMALKGAIYDCGGALTGAYAKEVALTSGYQYLYNVWLM